MARERITKGAVGSRGNIEKEIRLSVIKSGYGAGNTQRWSVSGDYYIDLKETGER